MGISSKQAYRIQCKLLSYLADAYASAISFRSTHDHLIKRTREIYASPELAKAPYYVRAYLQGYEQARRDELYNRHLVWMLWLDDRLVDSSDVDAATAREKESGESEHPNYRSPWRRVDGDRSRHVWRKRDVKNRDVPGRVGDPSKPFDGKWLESTESAVAS